MMALLSGYLIAKDWLHVTGRKVTFEVTRVSREEPRQGARQLGRHALLIPHGFASSHSSPANFALHSHPSPLCDF